MPPSKKVHIGNVEVLEVPSIKILVLTLQHNHTNTCSITQLKSQVTQTIGILRRITARNKGLKEADRIASYRHLR